MNIQKKSMLILSLGALCAIALTGCGKTKSEGTTQMIPQYYTGSNGTYTGTNTGTGTGSGSSGLPALSYAFTLTGTGGTATTYSTPPITTDNILKVRILPGPPGVATIPNSNWSANYGCIAYSITVLGQQINTQTLNVGDSALGICPNAPSAQTIDLSNRLTAGHGAIQITISNPRTDFYCQGCYTNPYAFNAYYYGCNLYCPLHTVYRTHTVTGTIEVTTNSAGF